MFVERTLQATLPQLEWCDVWAHLCAASCVSPPSYWLWKGEGEARVQLYDLSSLSNSRMLRWKYMMAMLCYRYASQLRRVSQPTEEPVARYVR